MVVVSILEKIDSLESKTCLIVLFKFDYEFVEWFRVVAVLYYHIQYLPVLP